MIEPTPEDIGRMVIYREHGTHRGRKVEEGVLTSYTSLHAFVRYSGSTSAATSFEDLEWSHRRPSETAIATTMKGGKVVEIDFCEPPKRPEDE